MKEVKLINTNFLEKKLNEYKVEIKDNAIIFLKWHNDNQKEEALQTNFLNDIFGKVLGYEIDTGEAEFNLLTEYKTQKDGTKVDGVLGFITRDKKDIRVAIELKAKNTTNLDTVEKQAFEYRDKIDGIEWVITSNTNEIRLYSAGSGGRLKYQSWTLFELANSIEKQKEFYFLLSKDRLFGAEKSTSSTHKLLEDNTKEEELIEKRFYNDYKDLRKKLFNHLREQNPTKEPTTLLSKTQKLLDRIIFVCFCEDLGLLPDKIFTKLLKTAQDAFVEITIWQQIKGLFNAIDKGFPQKNINKFNGGLFAKDAELDKLVLQDDILKEIIKISDWDFGSELTVNILGHIFEQSITDLEEIKADISGETHDKKQGKRKKDGVFYTPEYITRYIVEEAVGGWLNDRKNELGIEKLSELTEEDLIKKSKKPTKNAQKHIDFWNSYAKTLQNIKVLDPACGSGAFLVAVFNFLENEWLTLSETLRKLGDDEQAGLFSYSQVYKNILKNNIYGVDLNPESVQITKLSLWLKTANRSEELTTLDANIKCGNSLIDDATIETGFYINNEGERVSLAFNWQNKFPHVFENGGFDVVVGNPPYGAGFDDQTKVYLRQKYPELEFKIDSYVAFISQATKLANANTNIGFIVPNTMLDNFYCAKIRKLLINAKQIKEIVDLNDKVFEGAVVHSMILAFANNATGILEIKTKTAIDSEVKLLSIVDIKKDENYSINLRNIEHSDLLGKLEINCKKLQEVLDVKDGIDTGDNAKYIVDIKINEDHRPLLRGKSINRYIVNDENLFVNYGKHLANPRNPKIFEQPKILIRETGDRIIATYDENNFYIMSSLYNCIPKDENYNLLYLLPLLNSKLFNFIMKLLCFDKTAGAFTKARIFHYYNLPIKIIPPTEQTPLITHAQKMLDLTKQLNDKSKAFVDYFRGKFALQKITRNLESWHTLEFADFIKELGKQKVSLSSTDEFDFKPLFDREKKVCVDLQAQITKTDAEIDKMVYTLYGLSEEEIGVVEGLVV